MGQEGWNDSLFQRELDEEERQRRNEELQFYYGLQEGLGVRRLYGYEYGYREPYYDDRRRELQGCLEEYRASSDYDYRNVFLRDCGRDEEERRNLLDGWSFTFDHDFARDFFQSSPAAALPTQLSPVRCCIRCSSILTENSTINLSDVSTAEEVCRLCSLLLRTVGRYHNEEPNVQIVRQGSALKLGINGPRILRLCSDLEYSAGINKDIQIGFPVLPEAENPARFTLLCAWLRWCDKSHECDKRHTKLDQALPTRLLWVGNPDDPDYNPDLVRLNTSTDESGGKYIALSHCWGDLLLEDKKRFCTTRENIDHRQGGFRISDLPKTFQDAIKVTRELRVLYLWIDSLCIIQFGDNGEDWERELQSMERVFSSAYCTIAATSAVDSNAGFLGRNISKDYVYVENASGQRFYVCTDIDDFSNDVEKARLNTRAWVMQERVLSRRTISFSANQMYFQMW